MKTFDLKKTGILLVIMLVAGVVLVGPVSAFAQEIDSSAADHFWVSATGNYYPNQCTTYSGYSWTKDGNDAGKLYVKAQIFDGSGLLISDSGTQYNVQDLEVSGVYYHAGETLNNPYAKATMNSDNPDDIGFVYAYGI
jgi:hypothetical protein